MYTSCGEREELAPTVKMKVSPVLLTLVRTPWGRRELWVSLIGCGLPTRSNRPAAAAQVSRMKQATVEVKSPTSMV